MSNLIPLRPGAEEYARAETERKKQLFAWADRVLQELGLVERVARANSVNELRRVVFDPDAVEVELAIRDALHPAHGAKADYFAGLREGGLKRLLKARFDELKREHEAQLKAGGGAGRSARDWTDDLKLDKHGGVRPILTNLMLFLREHPRWKGVLAYDKFSARVVMRKRPPFGDEAPDTPWTDHHESLTRIWFEGEDIVAAQGNVARAVQVAARSNPFHPVHDYFDALVWDGVPRLDTWLVKYFHTEDMEYTRAIGPRFLISAVARIYDPGCKVDNAPIFEGPQGRQKSEALRTLAVRDDWFTDRLSHVGSKDAALEAAGVLFVELAEMDALTRASNSSVKSFITRRFDRFRPPYGKHLIRLQRQCVFAGTINPPVGGYLTDSTGARRYWPLACQGMIDRDGIERDRDQLWAEAIVRYRAGARWHLETPELEALATAEQAARFKRDDWYDPVAEWVGNRRDVSIAEVLKHALGIATQDQTQTAQNRVVKILKLLRFRYCRPRKGGKRENRYRREKYQT